MRERIDNRGSCVFSWTIELDPIRKPSQLLYPNIPRSLHTELNHDGEMFLALHAYLLGSIPQLAIALHVKAGGEWPDPTALTAEHLTRYAITNRSDEKFIGVEFSFCGLARQEFVVIFKVKNTCNKQLLTSVMVK